MNLLTIFTCAVLNLIPVTKAKPIALVIDTPRIAIEQYAILPYDKDRDFTLFDLNVKPATLSADEIKKIERVLRKQTPEFSRLMVTSAKERASVNEEPLDPPLTKKAINDCSKYYKQFVTVTNEKGQKTVWVNCFCFNKYPDWKTKIVAGDESSNCYFKFKINLITDTITDFWMNGTPYQFEEKHNIMINMPSRGRGGF